MNNPPEDIAKVLAIVCHDSDPDEPVFIFHFTSKDIENIPHDMTATVTVKFERRIGLTLEDRWLHIKEALTV